jgi:carbon storage regulator
VAVIGVSATGEFEHVQQDTRQRRKWLDEIIKKSSIYTSGFAKNSFFTVRLFFHRSWRYDVSRYVHVQVPTSGRSNVLVLSRKRGEEIVIGDDVRIVVNRISGNRVTLAIRAPNDVRIVRGELDRFLPPTDAPPPDGRRERLVSAV